MKGGTYKKVFHCFDDEFCQYPTFEGLIREENQKTYFVFSGQTNEYLLYDFSVELNDIIELTIPSAPDFITLYKVRNISYMEINGILKKKIELSHPSGGLRDIWVENLGSLFNFYTIDHRSGYAKSLSCYFQENELIYKNPKYPNCYHYSNLYLIKDSQPNLIIQQGVEQNTVFVKSKKDDSLKIINSQGVLIETIHVYANQIYNLNTSNYPDGLYIISSSMNGSTAKKFIKF